MSAAEIDAVLRSAQWHQKKGAGDFKLIALEAIMKKTDELDKEDTTGHNYWGNFFDFINELPMP
jgi:hypothetical protein